MSQDPGDPEPSANQLLTSWLVLVVLAVIVVLGLVLLAMRGAG
jgi:hypothetical protein